MDRKFTYLALGDSYTVGEAVLLQQSFPYQVIQILREKGHLFSAAEIIAKTGWTTDELWSGMGNYQFLPKYDFVSLLIGVNNQYRGKSIEEYNTDFEKLLAKALALADNKKEHVIVLSIPDYSVTPFCKEKDRLTISKEVDIFNTANRALATQYKVHYVEITEGTRNAATDSALVAEDGLHPSGKEYQKWAVKVAAIIEKQLK
ncbi:MAG TPA: GDSL-type esterase/lipase family protein [Flavisolibacter sp.]|nr:GDSL-type esterase/lipase family protein [Flavisolibacter sp.]